MPQIIVKADVADGANDGGIMLRDRVNVSDFESGHFAAQLVERINWAVGDAAEVERDGVREPERELASERELATDSEQGMAGERELAAGHRAL